MFDDGNDDGDGDDHFAFDLGSDDGSARTVEDRRPKPSDHREYMTVLTGRMTIMMALQVLQTVALEGKLPVAVAFDDGRFSIAARGKRFLWARAQDVMLSLGYGRIISLPSVDGLVALHLIAHCFAKDETFAVRFEHVADDSDDDGCSVELEKAIFEYCLLVDKRRQ